VWEGKGGGGRRIHKFIVLASEDDIYRLCAAGPLFLQELLKALQSGKSACESPPTDSTCCDDPFTFQGPRRIPVLALCRRISLPTTPKASARQCDRETGGLRLKSSGS